MIFYIEKGEIREQGNHKELLKQKWKYYTMLELQSGF
jgi:ABC-type multidrug transport system fused ATPase/permease subunit